MNQQFEVFSELQKTKKKKSFAVETLIWIAEKREIIKNFLIFE